MNLAMLTLNTIRSASWSRKGSKRLGRGNGSGKGSYCGRGQNGQNCRSGGGVGPWFEWGQTPLFRRMPKLRGFSNAQFMAKYSIVNVSDLEALAQTGVKVINKETLIQAGIIRNKNYEIKVLWDGEITSKIELKVKKISSSAQQKIEKAWGKVELI